MGRIWFPCTESSPQTHPTLRIKSNGECLSPTEPLVAEWERKSLQPGAKILWDDFTEEWRLNCCISLPVVLQWDRWSHMGVMIMLPHTFSHIILNALHSTWCIYVSCLSAFLCFWLVCPSARVNKSYVNVNVKGSISAVDRKRNNGGFFYSSIINEDWRLIYCLITRLHREWCRDIGMEGVCKKERMERVWFPTKIEHRDGREEKGRMGISDLINCNISQQVFLHKCWHINYSVIVPVTIS